MVVQSHLHQWTAQALPQVSAIAIGQVDHSRKTTEDAFGNTIFSILFQVTPSGGKFQAIAKVIPTDGNQQFSELELIGTVERKNKYGEQNLSLYPNMRADVWLDSYHLPPVTTSRVPTKNEMEFSLILLVLALGWISSVPPRKTYSFNKDLKSSRWI